jgi:hypothetical protein
MNRKRLIAIISVGIGLCVCLFVLSTAPTLPRPVWSRHNVGIVGLMEHNPRNLDREQLEDLCESHRDLADRHALVVAQAQQLSAEHAKLAQRLDEVNSELYRLYETVSRGTRALAPPRSWQERMLEKNSLAFAEIRDMLAELHAEGFAARRTWYADEWTRLTEPIVEGQFPTDRQRNRLAELIDEMMECERQRLVQLRQHTVILTASKPDLGQPGYCLRPDWEELAKNLRVLEY